MRIKLEILLIITICLCQITKQHVEDDENEIETDFGDIFQTFLESDHAKHVGDALFSLGANRNANQILEGIGAVLGGDTSKGSLDPSLLKTIYSAITENAGSGNNIVSWLIELFGKEGGRENLMSFLPMVFSAFNSFVETEGQKGESSGHDWLLPTVVEKAQEIINYFTKSEIGNLAKSYVKQTDLYKMFKNRDGDFDFTKFGESLENHSFRKHWIEVIASQITPMLERLFEPSFRALVSATLEGQLNHALKNKGFPKKALFNVKEPVDSLSSIINYSIEDGFGYKFRSKQYIKPIYEYLKNIYNDIMYKGYFGGKKMKHEELTKQVTDVINLELIEPIIRVYRAYRFAKNNIKCDKYVMCLVNQEIPDENVKLPKIKWVLYKASSLAASWSLSSYTDTSFWTLYANVMDNKSCEDVFHKSCEGFHAEEVRVKKEYVHSEL